MRSPRWANRLIHSRRDESARRWVRWVWTVVIFLGGLFLCWRLYSVGGV